MKILLVEDNKDLALNIIDFFEGKGHIMDYSADGLSGLNLVLRNRYDVIVLDIMLPGLDGFKLCQELRDRVEYETPVIMLTAKDTEQDKLTGFSVGTDDYLVKPFSLLELEARLFALLRRAKKHFLGKRKLEFGDLVYDPATMNLTRDGIKLSLKPVPLKILLLLMQNACQVVTRQQIENAVWNDDPPDSEVLRSHIYVIRKELRKHGSTDYLHTIRGVGYILGET